MYLNKDAPAATPQFQWKMEETINTFVQTISCPVLLLRTKGERIAMTQSADWTCNDRGTILEAF